MTTIMAMFEGDDTLDAIFERMHLTTDSSQSTYGAPVLKIGSEIYGPADVVLGTSQSSYPGAGMTAARHLLLSTPCSGSRPMMSLH